MLKSIPTMALCLSAILSIGTVCYLGVKGKSTSEGLTAIAQSLISGLLGATVPSGIEAIARRKEGGEN
jgi:hypothetical protein